jgi:hypothetical protein
VPTFEQTIELSVGDAATPIFRRLHFVNPLPDQNVFHVHFNYRGNVGVSPTMFALGPRDSQHISIRIENLALVEGQREGRWPVWIFINDKEDKTVESYLLQVVVRSHQVFHR